MKRLIYIILLAQFILSCSVEGESVDLQVAHKQITVEIADTEQLRAKGLMNWENMAWDTGMLFIFEEERKLSFWMKNTLIPLSIAYISKNGVIKEIHKMYPLDESSVSSSRSVMYALEMNQGWFEDNNISIGDKIIIPENL